jgi:anti-anti-sigma factor
MQLDEYQEGIVTVLSPVGQILAEENEDFSMRLDQLLSSGVLFVVLDVHRLSSINSRAIGDLSGGCYQMIERGGVMALAAVPPPIQGMLESAGLFDVIPIYDTVESAVAELTARPSGAI